MKKLVLVFASVFALSLNAQTFINYPGGEIGINIALSDLIVDDQNNYWVTSWAVDNAPGIASFNGIEWQTYGPDQGSAGFGHRGLFQSTTGDFYFGFFLEINEVEGFEIFDGTSWTHYTTADGLGGIDVFNFNEAANGDIWVCHNSGLSRFDGTSFINYGIAEGLTGVPLEIITDSNGLTWMATGDGAFSFDGTIFTQYTVDDGLVTNALFAVHEDLDGNLWFGGFEFDNPGVTRFDGTTFTTFSEVTDAVRKINSDSNGNLYFGLESSGVSIYDGTNFTFITENDGLIGNRIRGIAENSDGNMVFSTWQGVSVYNPTLGIIEQQIQDFKVFPNPTTNILQIDAVNFQISELAIYDIVGSLVQQQNVTSDINQISLAQLTSGVYLLKFSNTEGQHLVRKVVKQ